MARVRLSIKPELMRWARVSAGISARAAIEHFGLTTDEFAAWESAGAEVTPRQLEGIAQFYNRSTAVFFMPEAPPEPPMPVDFRSTLGMGQLDSQTILALRRARRLQRIFTELQAELGEMPQVQLPTLRLGDDPVTSAAAMRTLLGVPVSEQVSWNTPAKALRGWRRALEGLGLLVFQDVMPEADAEGFSLPGPVPVVVVNLHDPATRRMFTLFHEVAHLCLSAPGICVPDVTGRVRQQREIEFFCNAFAGHVLVPTHALQGHREMVRFRSGEHDLLTVLGRIARVFSVSREVVLWRMRDIGAVSASAFTNMQAQLAAVAGRGGGGGISTWPERRVARLGGRFVGAVLKAHEQGIATYADVCDYLRVKVKHISELHNLLTTVA